MIIVGPLGDRAVTLQAAMGDHRATVDALGNHFGLLEGGIRLAPELLCRLLIMRGRLDGLFDRGLLQGRDYALVDLVLAQLADQGVVNLETDAMLVDLGDD